MRYLICLLLLLPSLVLSAQFLPMGCLGVSKIDCYPSVREIEKPLVSNAEKLKFAKTKQDPQTKHYGQPFVNQLKKKN